MYLFSLVMGATIYNSRDGTRTYEIESVRKDVYLQVKDIKIRTKSFMTVFTYSSWEGGGPLMFFGDISKTIGLEQFKFFYFSN